MSERVSFLTSLGACLRTCWRLVSKHPFLVVVPVLLSYLIADRDQLNQWVDEAWEGQGGARR